MSMSLWRVTPICSFWETNTTICRCPDCARPTDEYPDGDTCPACAGEGATLRDGTWHDCTACGGDGYKK